MVQFQKVAWVKYEIISWFYDGKKALYYFHKKFETGLCFLFSIRYFQFLLDFLPSSPSSSRQHWYYTSILKQFCFHFPITFLCVFWCQFILRRWLIIFRLTCIYLLSENEMMAGKALPLKYETKKWSVLALKFIWYKANFNPNLLFEPSHQQFWLKK